MSKSEKNNTKNEVTKKETRSVAEIEKLIKQKKEVDNKQQLKALKESQRNEMKALRNELRRAKYKKDNDIKDKVGEHVMKMFKTCNEANDYIQALDVLLNFWTKYHDENGNEIIGN